MFLTIQLTIDQHPRDTVYYQGCEAYTFPSGNRTVYQSGIYFDTLAAATGCDSIIRLDVQIQGSAPTPMQVIRCHSFALPSGSATITQSGLYQEEP